MKVIFSYNSLMWPDAKIKDAERYSIFYSKYFTNVISFSSLRGTISILEDIRKLENNEIEVSESGTIMFDIAIYIYKDVVKFEQNEGYWEDWECPTIELKKALIRWKKFIALPKDPYRRMIVKINNL